MADKYGKELIETEEMARYGSTTCAEDTISYPSGKPTQDSYSTAVIEYPGNDESLIIADNPKELVARLIEIADLRSKTIAIGTVSETWINNFYQNNQTTSVPNFTSPKKSVV